MKLFSPSGQGRQWLGFLLSPTACSAYFTAVYLLNEAACKLTWLPATAVFPGATLLSLLTLGAIGYAGWLAYGVWRQEDGREGNGRFLGQIGLLLSGLFGVATITVWVSAWVLRPC
ncbi:MAG: hypothetical protein H6658_11940 [Ardenticatenaceae bacterium]|nr:hypothetical protein [Ardenticatenaceae bacterium]